MKAERDDDSPADGNFGDFDLQLGTNDVVQLELDESTDGPLNPTSYLVTLEYKRLNRKRDLNGDYKCTECDYQTRRIDNFESHFRQHTDEKPFQCKLCEQTFRNKSHCLQHIRQHDDRLKLSCKICDAKFVNHRSILQHTTKYHNGEGYTRKRQIFNDGKRKRIKRRT